jgi:hypothetical protein
MIQSRENGGVVAPDVITRHHEADGPMAAFSCSEITDNAGNTVKVFLPFGFSVNIMNGPHQ